MVAKKRLLRGLKNLKFSNRLSYTLITLSAIIILAATVYAGIITPPGTAPNPGHTFNDEITPPTPCANGQFLKWNTGGSGGAFWSCVTISTPAASWAPTDVKFTTAKHNGNFGGYKAMYDWIQANGCSGYHVCDATELTSYYQTHTSPNLDTANSGWYNSGMKISTSSTLGSLEDCGSWTRADNDYTGPMWSLSTNPGPWYATCEYPSRTVMCCK